MSERSSDIFSLHRPTENTAGLPAELLEDPQQWYVYELMLQCFDGYEVDAKIAGLREQGPAILQYAGPLFFRFARMRAHKSTDPAERAVAAVGEELYELWQGVPGPANFAYRSAATYVRAMEELLELGQETGEEYAALASLAESVPLQSAIHRKLAIEERMRLVASEPDWRTP